MSLELLASVAVAAIGATGSWWWLRTHSHPELVRESELELVRALLRSQHSDVLRRLDRIESRLDSGPRRG